MSAICQQRRTACTSREGPAYFVHTKDVAYIGHTKGIAYFAHAKGVSILRVSILRRFIPVNADTHDDSDTDHIDHQRCTAVTDKRQRNAGQRHDPDQHPDIFKNLENKHRNDARNDERTAERLRLDGNQNHPVNEQKIKQQQNGSADETKFLTDDNEDGIRVSERNKIAVDGGALKVALAEQTAGTDRRHGIVHLPRLVFVNGIRIDEGCNAVNPMPFTVQTEVLFERIVKVLKQIQEKRNAGHHHGQSDKGVGIFDISDPQQRHKNDQINNGIAQVRLIDHEHKRDEHNDPGRDDIPDETQFFSLSAGKKHGQRDNKQQLDQFGRLKIKAAGQNKPAFRAVKFFAENHNGDQAGDPDSVQIPMNFFKKTVIKQRKHNERQKTDSPVLQYFIEADVNSRVVQCCAMDQQGAANHHDAEYNNEGPVQPSQFIQHQ